MLEAIAHEDPDWLSVQIEATRRVRTDKRFGELVERLDKDAERRQKSRFDRLRPTLREDVPIGTTVAFLSFVANGLAFARTTGDKIPDLDLLNELVESGVGRR